MKKLSLALCLLMGSSMGIYAENTPKDCTISQPAHEETYKYLKATPRGAQLIHKLEIAAGGLGVVGATAVGIVGAEALPILGAVVVGSALIAHGSYKVGQLKERYPELKQPGVIRKKLTGLFKSST